MPDAVCRQAELCIGIDNIRAAVIFQYHIKGKFSAELIKQIDLCFPVPVGHPNLCSRRPLR